MFDRLIMLLYEICQFMHCEASFRTLFCTTVCAYGQTYVFVEDRRIHTGFCGHFHCMIPNALNTACIRAKIQAL